MPNFRICLEILNQCPEVFMGGCKMFEGSFVAIVTPFKDDGSLDEEKLQELIEFQIENGTQIQAHIEDKTSKQKYTISKHQSLRD